MLTLLPKQPEVLQRLREEQAQLQSRHGPEITGRRPKGPKGWCLGRHSCEWRGSEANQEAPSQQAMQEVPCLAALHHELLTSNNRSGCSGLSCFVHWPESSIAIAAPVTQACSYATAWS